MFSIPDIKIIEKERVIFLVFPVNLLFELLTLTNERKRGNFKVGI